MLVTNAAEILRLHGPQVHGSDAKRFAHRIHKYESRHWRHIRPTTAICDGKGQADRAQCATEGVRPDNDHALRPVGEFRQRVQADRHLNDPLRRKDPWPEIGPQYSKRRSQTPKLMTNSARKSRFRVRAQFVHRL